MSRVPPMPPSPESRFPRVSGDEPMPRDGFASEVEFSPRERG